MKNNKYILFTLMAIIVMAVTSCHDDFLEVPPNTNLPNDEFWKTSNDAVFGVNSIYLTLAEGSFPLFGTYGGTLRWIDVLSDDAMWTSNATATASGAWGNMANGIDLAGDFGSYSNRTWTSFYKMISRANNAITKIEGIDMDTDLKKRLIAEAKFFRAHAYHRLSIYYGDVPLLLLPFEEENPVPARDPYTEVRAQIIKDLTEASVDLPVSYGNADLGRITKGAALTALMQANMYTENWAEATTAAEEVMSLGVYQLLPDFSDLWIHGNEETVESIWEVHFGSDTGGNLAFFGVSDFPSTAGGGGGFTGWGGFSTPQQQLVNEFETAIDNDNDGVIDIATPFDSSSIGSLFDTNQYVNRDPRLAASIWYNGADYFGVPYDPDFATQNSGYHWKKGNASPAADFPNGRPEYNTIIYRYAYVLLGFAESKNEVSGPDASVYSAINQVRQRVNMPELATGLNQDQMREAIRHERRVELAGENHRHEDLRRWGLWKQAIENRGINNGRQQGSVTIAPGHELFPISQGELDANPNMVQNEAYK
ncbi:RagB/SusD family nutrient uptake outer membrane protein [Flavivirga spongiicola]|uniref:RagB/SusD family nutrient uptake outer membrane protein n=1 Tax=Flavivirga spongiicola TaxID=421621 RepID=A0ABU7XWM6_9FLAO|nr:RagB/SusD family nutrient uptake outer membrane protein [Flavivirga sp. MEBiC05379]MDO5980186.1 RagB/SusD family nutrient uptake outer membrane protein [Flavivirga sp. MEBiC05379]